LCLCRCHAERLAQWPLFFLAWLLFEDFARKFLGNNMVIYFAKDFLAAVVYFSFIVAIVAKRFLVPASLPRTGSPFRLVRCDAGFQIPRRRA